MVSRQHRKGGGLAFSKRQIREFAEHIHGGELPQDVDPLSCVKGAREDDGIGHLLQFVFIPSHMDVDKDEDNKCAYMLVLTIRDLGKDETARSFSDIPFDRDDPDVEKGLKWFMRFGYSEEEFVNLWTTLSSWSFRTSVFYDEFY